MEFSLKNKTSILEASVNKAVGIRKEKIKNLREYEINSNTLFETTTKNYIKDIWFNVLKESKIVENPSENNESLSAIFEGAIEQFSKYDSKQLRDNKSKLPWFLSETIKVIEYITEASASAGNDELIDDEKQYINKMATLNGSEDSAKEISKTVDNAIELSTDISKKIVDYEEDEMDARLAKVEKEKQLEAASNIIRRQNSINRNLLESIVINRYKTKVNVIEDNDKLNEAVQLESKILYSLLETLNQLEIADIQEIKKFSDVIRNQSLHEATVDSINPKIKTYTDLNKFESVFISGHYDDKKGHKLEILKSANDEDKANTLAVITFDNSKRDGKGSNKELMPLYKEVVESVFAKNKIKSKISDIKIQ